MQSKPKNWVIVPAAGIGQRMATELPKQYLPLSGCTVLGIVLKKLAMGILPNAIIVAINAEDPIWTSIAKPDVSIIVANGGHERCHSVLNALRALEGKADADDWVWVHDAARPCVRVEDLQNLSKAIEHNPVGGLLAIKMTDTVKQANADLCVETSVDRDVLWRAVTPQVFRYTHLLNALDLAIEQGIHVTDEAQAMERQGHHPQLIECDADNIKITSPGDLELAEFYLQQQAKSDNISHE